LNANPDIPIDIRADVHNLRQRTTLLLWAVGILAGVMIAVFANLLVATYQLGQITGRLDVLISHVQMR
jgi:hypothetical protein